MPGERTDVDVVESLQCKSHFTIKQYNINVHIKLNMVIIFGSVLMPLEDTDHQIWPVFMIHSVVYQLL